LYIKALGSGVNSNDCDDVETASVKSFQQEVLSMMDLRFETSKKESIAQGIQNMLAVVADSSTRASLESQLASLNKEIQVLRKSYDSMNVREGTATPNSMNLSSQNDMSPKKLLQIMNSTYESNGHTFKIKNVAPGLNCEHCRDSLFGNNQTLECKNCRMVCHKYCHVAIKETCAEHLQLQHASKWYFMAADEADRTRWITGLESIRSSLREQEATARRRDKISTSISRNNLNSENSLVKIEEHV
jgi:hypothetical protein